MYLMISSDIKQSTVNIFTDGSKNETGVGSGIAIFVGEKLTQQLNSNSPADARTIKQ